MEALVRWQHPERGLLLPQEFIPRAEENGAIVPLGRWVMKTACAEARRWREQSNGGAPVAVSVNLSARQFSQSDVLALACEALDGSGLPAPGLRLELTESALMDDPAGAAAKLGQLKQLGVNLDIDDFGTGYSSLSYLRRFPIDALKIDRAFVSRMDAEVEDREIVRTIVTLAANLGVSAVAEGVETGAGGPAAESPLPLRAGLSLLAPGRGRGGPGPAQEPGPPRLRTTRRSASRRASSTVLTTPSSWRS
jgi:EAL domain-containing protein (putative c-di-GMP-specific phosphodiesterase class I)